jgi:hypothetical protein
MTKAAFSGICPPPSKRPTMPLMPAIRPSSSSSATAEAEQHAADQGRPIGTHGLLRFAKMA